MRILMVCLGNICRSPLAEGIMRQLVNEQTLNWEIASAGTGSWHVGNPPDKRSILVAKKYGFDISAQRAKLFTANTFDEFDHIFVMDKNNYQDVLSLATNGNQIKKVQFFLADNAAVKDPYYDDEFFEPIFKQIEDRCKVLIEQLKQPQL